MLQVAPATEAHLPGILSILNHMIRHTDAIWTEDEWDLDQMNAWFNERTAAKYPVLVAVENGQVVGYCSYAQFRAKSGYCHTMEHTVYVADGQQGKGVGNVLMEKLVERARQDNVHALVAGIDAGNRGSIRFHERLGFVQVGHMPEVGIKRGRWLDLVFMQLTMN